MIEKLREEAGALQKRADKMRKIQDRINYAHVRELLERIHEGPWKLSGFGGGFDSGGRGVITITSITEGVVSLVPYTPMPSDGKQCLPDHRYRADAALIALAPQLAREVLRLHEKLRREGEES